MVKKEDLIKVNEFISEIPKRYRSDMRIPARIYASDTMLQNIFRDKSLEQLVNVATLPGIVSYALAMPDMHEGYGFPIGGVAAFDLDEGIISPGGVGYDINCGVRLLTSNITFPDIKDHLEELGHALYREVPSGVGKGGRLTFKGRDLDSVLEKGASRLVQLGYGEKKDLENTESNGMLDSASSELVSSLAKDRGSDQLGTLGAGNHFIEVETVEAIFDEDLAKRFGLFMDQIVILVHTGSRGLGHQVATDYIKRMMNALSKYKIALPDRELVCAPFKSSDGQDYFRAMNAAANYAWANRQLITWEIRNAWNNIMGKQASSLDVLYDVAHNIAKVEEYVVGKQKKMLIVHRKGATRSFPDIPVLIPGSMGTGSYLLVGSESAMRDTFGSSCHGAGRLMSRTQARKQVSGYELKERLNKMGIVVNTGSFSGFAEEAPEAYKNVDEVVETVAGAGIAKKVARFKTVLVVKG